MNHSAPNPKVSRRPYGATAPYPEAIPFDPAGDSFNLIAAWNSIKQAIWRYWLLILAVTAVTLGLIVTYIVVWPSTYQAEVALISAAEKDPDRDSFYSTWAVFRRNDISDEIVLFGSGPVLKAVIEDQDLTFDDVYHPPLRYAVHLWAESRIGNAWRDFKAWLFPKEDPPYAPTEEEIELARTIDDFREGVSVQQIGNSNVGLLVVRASTPRVHQIANSVADTYLQQRRETFAIEARQAYDALKVEVDKAREELTTLEREMEQYYTENDMLLMFEKDKIEIGQFETAQATLAQIRRELASMRTELANVTDLISTVSREVLSARQVQQSPVYAAYEQQIAQLLVNRQILTERYREDSPEIRDVDNQIAALRQQMGETAVDRTAVSSVVRSNEYETLAARQKELMVKIAGKETEVEQLTEEVERQGAEIDKIPQKMKISHDLGRKHMGLEKKYMLLQERLMTAAVSAATAASAPSTIRIVERATPPEKPIAPKKKLLLLAGMILGLSAGIVLAVLLDLRAGYVNGAGLAQRRGPARIYATVRSNKSRAPTLLGPV